jgi:hypothetical protein
VALVAITWLLDLIRPPMSPLWMREGPLFWELLFAVLVLTYSTVGAFVASRRPGNPIGWIFCGAGLLIMINFFVTAYAAKTLSAWGVSTTGAAQYFAWLSAELALLIMALATVLLLLLFPSGQLPSGLLSPEARLPARSWQVVVWMAVGGSAMVALWVTSRPGPWGVQPSVGNPLYIGGTVGAVVGVVGRMGVYLLFVSLLFAAASLISRLMLARGEERQQLKWFAYAAAMMIGGFLGAPLMGWSDLLWDISWFVGVLGFASLPVATAIAILRYRLYDIDLLINRTLVYGSLTALLALVYLGGVTLLQALFRTLTGQEEQLAVVASTLAIAAIFAPLRRRIQAFVDRRFYRRKYDASKTLEAFSAQLKDETDLDALSNDLVGVVQETMQPAHVSVWLRPDPGPNGASERSVKRRG